jgi:hypothetical protein
MSILSIHRFFLQWRVNHVNDQQLQSRYSIYRRRSARRRRYDALERVGWPLWTCGNQIQSTTTSTIQWKRINKIIICRSQYGHCRVNSGPPYTAPPAPLLFTYRRTIMELVEDRGGRYKAAIRTITKWGERENMIVALKLVLLIDKLTN